MARLLFMVLAIFWVGCLGLACNGSSAPTSAQGTPMPGNGGY